MMNRGNPGNSGGNGNVGRDEPVLSTPVVPAPPPRAHITTSVSITDKQGRPQSQEFARRNSFHMEIGAHHEGKRVGTLQMTFHQNQAVPEDIPAVDVGRRIPGQPTAYISRIDNHTFDIFNPTTQLKGVGSALMNKAEGQASEFGATKMSLDPAPTVSTRTEVPHDNSLLRFFGATKKLDTPQREKFDPTPFYEHRGYAKDPMQMEAHRAAFVNGMQASPETENAGWIQEMAAQHAQRATGLYSKSLSPALPHSSAASSSSGLSPLVPHTPPTKRTTGE
jgi:GNAT superfamily N-acetyltransferase